PDAPALRSALPNAIERLAAPDQRPPGLEASEQRPHARDALPPQEERHPGARRLVGSIAVDDDLLVAWDFVRPRLQLLGRDAQRARDGRAVDAELQTVTRVEHDERIAGVEPVPELLGGDARAPELAQQAPADEELPGNVAGEQRHDETEEHAAEPQRRRRDRVELPAEEEPERDH